MDKVVLYCACSLCSGVSSIISGLFPLDTFSAAMTENVFRYCQILSVENHPKLRITAIVKCCLKAKDQMCSRLIKVSLCPAFKALLVLMGVLHKLPLVTSLCSFSPKQEITKNVSLANCIKFLSHLP